MNTKQPCYGSDVLPRLACIYPQIFIKPGEDKEALYKSIVLAGEDAPVHDLAHFRMNPKDSAVYEQTPAGEVLSVTLHERADFECFIQIMAHRCKPALIPQTQGASMLDGVINWTKIRDHQAEFIERETAAGNPEPDWDTEFSAFIKDRKNYTDALIVLSAGPYSALPAKQAGRSEEQWIEDSVTIRKYHELNHYICRRMYPEKIAAIWDELVADAIGLYAAYGTYDTELAERFLGISKTVYTGGRLENYVTEEDPALKKQKLDALASVIHPILCRFHDVIAANRGIPVFEMIPILEDLFTGEVSA